MEAGGEVAVCTPEDLRAKRRLVEVSTTPKSEYPYKLFKKSTGVLLGAFKTEDEREAHLCGLSLTALAVKPTRTKRRG